MTDFSALWTEHRNYVFRLVLSSVRHASDADDLMQVIAIEAYKSFHTLRDPAKFRPWIRCIAVRVIKRYHKRFYTKPEELLDPAKLEERLSGYQPDFAADADARLLVRDFIEALPGKWADALARTCTMTFPSGTSTRCWAANTPRLTPTSAGCAVNWKHSVLRRR